MPALRRASIRCCSRRRRRTPSSAPSHPADPEPFVPLGTRIGSFLLFTALQTDGDYNSNVFASPVALGDYALELWPSARLASNWANHAVEIRASGDLSYHDKFPTEDDRAYLVEGLSRIDITRFSNIQAYVSHELAQESRSAINATSIGTRPDVVVDRASLAGNQRFNRLSVQVRGNVIDTRYGNDIVAGVTESNSDRDFTLYEEAMRPRWEFNPDLFFFSDISFNQRDYSTAAFTDGLNRTSNGERYRFGLSFGNTSPILNGLVSLGYGQQDYGNPLLVDDQRVAVRRRPDLAHHAVTYAAVHGRDRRGGNDDDRYRRRARAPVCAGLAPQLLDAAHRHDRRQLLQSRLRRRRPLRAAVHGRRGPRVLSLAASAVLFGRYQHTAFDTTIVDGNYTVEEVQLGVRLRH